jgi:hypothetical protein
MAALFIPPAVAPTVQVTALPATHVPTPASTLAGVYINQHVPLVLSLSPSNYSTWRIMFELTFCKFNVAEHIISAPHPHDP